MQKNSSGILTLRYGLLQGFYWAAFAAAIAFASVFLLSRGFSNTQIGVLLAVSNTLAAFAQPLLAAQVDKRPALSSRIVALALTAVALAAALLLAFLPASFWVTTVLFSAIIMLFQALGAFINALAFSPPAQSGVANYGVARAAGSLAYALVAWQLGSLIQGFGANTMLLVFSLLATALCLCLFFYRFPKQAAVPAQNSNEAPAASSLFGFLKKYRLFSLFLLGAVLIFTCYNICITYLAQIITGLGGSNATYGTAISVAAMLEIPTMLVFSRLVRRVKCTTLLKISGVFFLVKTLFYLLASGMGFIFAAQCMQPFSFALYTPASVHYVDTLLPTADKTKGHAFTSATFTVGAVLGTLSGGWLLDSYGAKTMLAVATVLSILGMLIFFYSARDRAAQKL